MFKKLSKGLLDQEAMPSKEAQGVQEKPTSFLPYENFRTISNFSAASTQAAAQEVEVHIGETARLEGSLAFEAFAVIDGHFTGELLSKGKIIIGPTAVVKADLYLEEADISGRVEGNITVTKKLILKGNANIVGDITAPSLSVDEGVSIRGQLHVTKIASPTEKEEELPLSEEPLG